MKRGLFALLTTLVVLAGITFAAPRLALAEPDGSHAAREHVQKAMKDGNFTFCKAPKRPFSPRQRELCPLAAEIEGCEGFVAACKADALDWEDLKKKTNKESSRGTAMQVLATLAKGLVWVLVLLVIGAIAFPLIRALLKARRDKAIADAPKPKNVASIAVRQAAPEPENVTDAEAALRDADEHARRGELARALSLYLAASLSALDRRGAIRLARHRTNGEYVRACAEDASRQPLREIVREVDKVEFGKQAVTSAAVANVAARANAVVRRPAMMGRGTTSMLTGVLLVLSLILTGCDGNRGGLAVGRDDPAGSELPMEMLRRTGFDVAYLTRPLVELPMPATDAAPPILVVDVDNVLLEPESTAHLLRWVEEGGVLVIFGAPVLWPPALHATTEKASSRDLSVLTRDVFARGARLAAPRAMAWPDSEAVAWLDKGVYAATKSIGKGTVVGVAGAELFTNAGVARPDNAAALAAILDIAIIERDDGMLQRGIASSFTYEVKVARREDGIPPPSNPFSALVQAGLGRGAWHALAAAVILFLAFGIRHARARPAAPATRRAFAEHVEATGAFYGRAKALGHALSSYGRFAELRLRERVPRGADPVQFLATRAAVPHEEAARVWKRATEAKPEDPPRGDELLTIRELRGMLEKALET